MGSSEHVSSESAVLERKLEDIGAVLSSVRPGSAETGIITVRHGLSVANSTLRDGDDHDVLSPMGEEQAREGSKLIRRLGIEIVLVSPIARAQHTAALLLVGTEAEVRLEPLCAERSLGQLEGIPRDVVETRFPGVGGVDVNGVRFWRDPPGGETLEELQARAARLRDAVIDHYSGRTVLIVSHGAFMLQLHGLLRGLGAYEALNQSFNEVWNCALNAFRVGRDGRELAHALVQLAPVNDEFPLSMPPSEG